MSKNVKQSGIPQLRSSKPSSIPTPTTTRQPAGDNEKVPKQANSPVVATGKRPCLLKNFFALTASTKKTTPHVDPGAITKSEHASGTCTKSQPKALEEQNASPSNVADTTNGSDPLSPYIDFCHGLTECTTAKTTETRRLPEPWLLNESVCGSGQANARSDVVSVGQRTAECAAGCIVPLDENSAKSQTSLEQTKCSQQSSSESPRRRRSRTFLVDDQPCDSERSNRTSDASDLDTTLTESNADKAAASSPTPSRTDQIELGQKVRVCGSYVGTVRYVGGFHLALGTFCGVELDEPVGLNDGTVDGHRYFLCRKKYGIIAPMDKVSPLAPPGAHRLRRGTFCIPLSGPESMLPTATACQAELAHDSETFRPVEAHEPFKSSPSTPGNVNVDWCNPAPSQTISTPSNYHHTLLHELSKHNSFEQDESLGILSPDQMKTDLTLYGDMTLTSFRQCQQPDDYPWSRFADLTCEASLLDNQECPIYLTDTLDESRDGLLASLQPLVEDGKRPPSSLPLKVGECTKSPSSDVFTPASTQADMSDRTLSPEELPLDEVCDPLVDLKLLDVVDPSEFTGSVSAEPSSRSSAPPVSSFVTSVTSITSLDNGYQGDGECSRPGSRGPDHYSPTAGHRPSLASALRVKGGTAQDPMTDSDFFTESDADVHEDVSAVAVGGRGDRKAQVIDGTLYGSSDSHSSASQSNGGATVLFSSATQQQHQRCPSFTASINEEMESSGVYSDLERKSDEQADSSLKYVPPDSDAVLVMVQPECSPDVSTKTSSHSDHSQVKDTFPITPSKFQETVAADVTVVMCGVVAENLRACQATGAAPVLTTKSPELSNSAVTNDIQTVEQSSKGTVPSTVPIAESKLGKSDVPYTIKKYKMPKRNVVSKVKTMIDSSMGAAKTSVADDGAEDQENKRPSRTKSPRKGGRWDAVMSKIAQGQAENKWTATKLKDVKSKVLLNIMPPPQSHNSIGLQLPGTGRNSSLLLPGSRLNQENTLKSKTRRNRTRASSSSRSQAQAGILNSSINSSAHSSVSDLSMDRAQHTLCKVSNKANTSLGTSKKRDVGRSTSPLSDGSTNSATSHVMTRPAANHHPPTGLPRQSPQKNGVSPSAPADMKTPAARKVASRRSPAAVQKPPTPLRDHNSRQQQAASGASKAPEVAPAPRKVPPAPVPTPEERLLPSLKHNASGFEALSVLVQYLVFDLEAFSTPQLRHNLEHLNGEWVHTKLELEEVQASYRRLGEEMCQKIADHQRETEQVTSAFQQQLSDLQVAHSHQLSQVSESHAAQMLDMEREHQQLVAAAEDQRRELLVQLDKAQQDAAQRDADHHKAMQEAEAREVELQQRLVAVDKENREEWRRVMDDLRKDKDSKLQVTAGHCKELQDEVQSLQAVVELRSQEIQELRRQNAELTWAAEEVQSARQRIQSLQARVEDLQAQLRDKTTFERQLSQENKNLVDSFHEENKQKKRLSQHVEELQYKLKQNKEYMLAALSTNLRSPKSSGSSDVFKTPSPHPLVLQSMSERPSYMQLPLHGDSESFPPQTPKVKSMVQKGDSVSWTLAMEEAPEIYARLIRRAGSFRGTTGSFSGCAASLVRSRTLPPPKRQCCKAAPTCPSSPATVTSPRQCQGSGGSFSVTGRSRSRSVSADSADDSVDMEAFDWDTGNIKRNLQEELMYDSDVSLDPLENSRDKVNTFGKLPGLDGGSVKRSSPSESSNEADSPSKSSTSSSSSSSSNGLVQNGKGIEHFRSHRRKKGSSSQLNLVSSASESMDNTDPEVLPLPPLPGSSSSSDLSLLAACSVVQNSKMPKESGGEAMISEEISEDEHQRDVVNSSDEQSSSDEDSS